MTKYTISSDKGRTLTIHCQDNLEEFISLKENGINYLGNSETYHKKGFYEGVAVSAFIAFFSALILLIIFTILSIIFK